MIVSITAVSLAIVVSTIIAATYVVVVRMLDSPASGDMTCSQQSFMWRSRYLGSKARHPGTCGSRADDSRLLWPVQLATLFRCRFATARYAGATML